MDDRRRPRRVARPHLQPDKGRGLADRVGIPVAQDTRGRLHARAAIDTVPPPYEGHKPLRCGGCTVGVVGTRSHPRRIPGGGVTQVMAHYAVTKYGEHDPGCRYDFKNRAERLIEDSRGTVVREGDIYELRLPDPHKIEPSDRLPASKAGRPQARLQVSTSDRMLTPALGSAARIVRLLREFDDDSDAARRFRARYAARKITWARFCRSTKEATLIASQLGEPIASQYPLALHGTVGTVGPAGGGGTHQLHDDQETYLDRADGTRRLRVVVRTKNADTFDQMKRGDRWLGYGHWRLWIAARAPIAEIQMWIDGPWSLATWRD